MKAPSRFLVVLDFGSLHPLMAPRKTSNLLAEPPSLPCTVCGRDVLAALEDSTRANVVALKTQTAGQEATDPIIWRAEMVIVCCKSPCSRTQQRATPKDCRDPWFDLDDLLMPENYVRQIVAVLGATSEGLYSKAALEKMREILIAVAPFVMRDMTDLERSRCNVLTDLRAIGC